MNGGGFHDVMVRDADQTLVIRVWPQPDGSFTLHLPSGAAQAHAIWRDADVTLRLGAALHRLRVVRHGGELVVIAAGRNHVLRVVDPLSPPGVAETGDDRVVAPIPARVARVLVAAGDAVRKGEPILVLEAMKTELTLRAPADGIVAVLRHTAGTMVDEGAELITFAAAAAP